MHFQWFSQMCNGCNTYIRVAPFNFELHSSMEDAMEDQRVLPFDQTEEWYEIDNVNSFQYPFSGAYPLEEGSVYCWQVVGLLLVVCLTVLEKAGWLVLKPRGV